MIIPCILSFIGGIIFGGFIGVALMAILNIAGKDDYK